MSNTLGISRSIAGSTGWKYSYSSMATVLLFIPIFFGESYFLRTREE